MNKVDYIVVGSGLTGATIARVLADAGRDVLVVERREHVGGNVVDAVHPCGIRYNMHGPHYFRTDSERIWEWAQRFGAFRKFEALVQTKTGDGVLSWPLNSWMLTGRAIDEAIHDYNRKMWGAEVPQEALERIPKYVDGRLKQSKYQGVPVDGYSAWAARMLDDVRVGVGEAYRGWKISYWKIHARMKVIWTGAIDELFEFKLGKLDYRTQRRELVRYPSRVQDTVQLNLPSPHVAPIRCIEWNHLMPTPSWDAGSLCTYETPDAARTTDEAEYPVNVERNKKLYAEYRKMADADDRLLVCGRLGEYRYMDMDAAIARALMLAEQLLKEA